MSYPHGSNDFFTQFAQTTEEPPQEQHSSPLTLLYGSPQALGYLAQLLGHFLQQCFHALCLSEEERTMLLAPEPGAYVRLLEQIATDPLFSSLLTETRKLQWTRVFSFAQQCEQAYQQGFQDAAKPFHDLLVHPESRLFQDRLQGDLQQTAYRQPETRSSRTPPAHDPVGHSLQQWYTRGYLAQERDLQMTQQSIW